MMKKTKLVLAAAVAAATFANASHAELIITGVIDGPLSGGTPKAVELFASTDIADLSAYGIDFANNGEAFSATNTPDVTLTAGPLAAGEFYYVASEEPNFTAYFGFAPDQTGSVFINGNDAIGLVSGGARVDTFGDPSEVTGSSDQDNSFNYLDSYAYRHDATGPDGATFVVGNFTIPGNDTLDGTTTAEGGNVPFGTYEGDPIPEPTGLGLLGLGALALFRRRRTR